MNLSKLLLQKSIPPKITLPSVYHFRALESKRRYPYLTKGDGRNDNCNAVAQQTLDTAYLCSLRPYNAFWPYEARHVRQGWSISARHAAHFLLCARLEYAHFHRRSASFRIREERTGEEVSSTVGTGNNEQSHGFFLPFVPIKGLHIPEVRCGRSYRECCQTNVSSKWPTCSFTVACSRGKLYVATHRSSAMCRKLLA
jgi:hypothetical protein